MTKVILWHCFFKGKPLAVVHDTPSLSGLNAHEADREAIREAMPARLRHMPLSVWYLAHFAAQQFGGCATSLTDNYEVYRFPVYLYPVLFDPDTGVSEPLSHEALHALPAGPSRYTGEKEAD